MTAVQTPNVVQSRISLAVLEDSGYGLDLFVDFIDLFEIRPGVCRFSGTQPLLSFPFYLCHLQIYHWMYIWTY